MPTANPPADPLLNAAGLNLLASLYNAGKTGKYYLGTNLGQDAWLNGPGFATEIQSYYLSTGKYPSVLGLYDEELAQNIYPPSPAGEYYYDTWGNQVPQWNQILQEIEWIAGYGGIIQAMFQGSDPISSAWNVTAAAATYVQSSTGFIVTSSGGSTVATVANSAVLVPTSVTGSGPYTVAMGTGLNSGTPVVPTAGSVSGSGPYTLTITAPGTWAAGQQVYLAGFSGGTGWSSITGTYTLASGTAGSFTVSTATVVSGTPTLTSAQVYTWGLIAGQPIVNGQTVAWAGSSGTWTVSAASTTPTNQAQATTFTLTQTSGSGGAAPATTLPMTVTAQSVINVSTATNGFNGVSTTGVATSNWGWGVMVLGTTAATRTLVRFTYTGWTGSYVTGVLVYQVPWFTGANTISSGQLVAPAQNLGLGGDSNQTTAIPLQWSTTAYNLTGVATSTTYQATQKGNANNNLNAQLDMFASLANILNAFNLPIIFRPYAESQGGQYWFGNSGGFFEPLWRYTIAYLTGGAGPAWSPGGFRGTAQAIKTTTSIVVSGNQATVTTNATHTLVAGDCVYFSGITGTASPMNGAILPITPGSSITTTTFVVTLTPALVAAMPTGSYTTGAGNVYQNQPVLGCNGLTYYGGTTSAPAVPTNIYPLAIGNAAGTGSTVTFTTPTAHGMLVGQTVQIAGYTTGGAVNGYQTITAVTAFSFSIASTVTSFAGSGTYQSQLVPVHNALYSYVILSSNSGVTGFTMPMPSEIDVHAADAYGNTAGLPNAVSGGLYQLQQNSGSTAYGSTAITSISTAGLVTMPAAHGLVVGDSVAFTGVTGGTGFPVANTFYTVTSVPSSTTFTITMTGSGTPSAYGTLLPYTNIPVGFCEWSNLLNASATNSSATLGYDTSLTSPITLGALQTAGQVQIPNAQASLWPTWNGSSTYNGILMASDGYHLFTHTGAFGPFGGNYYLLGLSIQGAYSATATLQPQASILPQIDLSTLQSGAGNLVARIFGVYDETNGAVTSKVITGGTITSGSAGGSGATVTFTTASNSGVAVGDVVQVGNGIGSIAGTWLVSAITGSGPYTVTITNQSWNTGAISGVTTSSTLTVGGFATSGVLAVPTTSGVQLVNYSAVQQQGLFSYVYTPVTFTLTTTAVASPPALASTIPAGSYLLPLGHVMQENTTFSNGVGTFYGTTALGSTGSTSGGPNYPCFVSAWSDNYCPLYQNPSATKTFFTGAGALPLSSPDSGTGGMVFSGVGYETAQSTGTGAVAFSAATIDSGGESPAGQVSLTGTDSVSGGESPAGQMTFAGTDALSAEEAGSGSITFTGTDHETANVAGTGVIGISGTNIDSGGGQASGAITLTPAIVDSAGEAPQGMIVFAGGATETANGAATGNVAVTGTAIVTTYEAGTGAISVTPAAADSAGASPSGALSLAGTTAYTPLEYLTPSGTATFTGSLGGGLPDSGGGTASFTGAIASPAWTVFDGGGGSVVFGGAGTSAGGSTGTGAMSMTGTTASSAAVTATGTISVSGTAGPSASIHTAGTVTISGTATGSSVPTSSGGGSISFNGTSTGKAKIVIPSATFYAVPRPTTFEAVARATTFVSVGRSTTFTTED